MSRTITRQLDMTPSGIPPVIHVSQYDSDFTLTFTLYNTDGTFTAPSGTTAKVRGTKSSGTGYSADATVSGTTVTVTGDQQMTVSAGRNVYEITLYNNGKELNSANFILHCERAALDMDTSTDETIAPELDNLQEYAERAEAAAARAEEAGVYTYTDDGSGNITIGRVTS